MRAKLKSFTINSALLVASVAVSLVGLEMTTRLFLDPLDFLLPRLEDDPVLGHRIVPGTGGHDSNGYRNRVVASSPRVITIGDSMTYGISANFEGSWPQQLARSCDIEVYNMSLGGYGPLQYIELTRRALDQFDPAWIVIGLYPGNDLFDAFRVAHGNPHWASYKLSEIDEKEHSQVITQDISTSYFSEFRNLLARTSVLYRALSQSSIIQKAKQVFETSFVKKSKYGVQLEIDAQKLSLNPDKIHKYTDINAPIAKEGLEILNNTIDEILFLSKKNGGKIAFITIPSKENVFSNKIEREKPEIYSDKYRKLRENENYIREEIKIYVTGKNLIHVEVFNTFQEAVDSGKEVYPFNDGHPNADGYKLISSELATMLSSQDKDINCNNR